MRTDEKKLILSDDRPINGDMVLASDGRVWEYRNENPNPDGLCYAPMPYWANYETCKKIIGGYEAEALRR